MPRKGRLIKVKEWGQYCNEVKVCEDAQRGIEAGTEFLLRTDKNGFIITGNHEIPGESLAVLGDSFTECLFVRERLRFCSVCERILRRSYSPSFSVLNAAMSGANIFHCNITLLAKIVPLRPKFVLLCLPSIDDKTLRMPDGYWNSDKNVSIFYDPSFDRAPLLHSADYTEGDYLAMIKLFFNILDAFSLRGAVCLRPFYRLHFIWYGRTCAIFPIRTGRITASFAAVCLICVRTRACHIGSLKQGRAKDLPGGAVPPRVSPLQR